MNVKSLLLLAFAIMAGYIFKVTGIPLPWTLGPLAATLCWTGLFKQPVHWPRALRNWAMVLLGYVMGSPFTPEIGQRILEQLPLMLLVTLISITASLLAGYAAGRYTGIGLINSLIGSIPGGLSQMSTICDEIKGTNAGIVTLMQTVRVLTVVFVVPFLSFHGLADNVHAIERAALTISQPSDFARLLLFAVTILSLIWLQKRFRLPSPFLIAPIAGTALLVLSGVEPLPLPASIIAGCQVCVGIRMGRDVGMSSIDNWRKIVWVNLLSVLSVIALLLVISLLFAHIASVSALTAFISIAPGGISEMGLTAMMTDADLPMVVSYQLFRLLFILLVAVPVIRWYLRRITQPKLKTQRS